VSKASKILSFFFLSSVFLFLIFFILSLLCLWLGRWDMGVIVPLLVYLTIMTPFRICFDNEPRQFSAGFWFEVSIEIAFLVDIVFNFRTGYFVDGIGDEAMSRLSVEYQPRSVAL
jgi:hypothetical protein